MFGGYISVKRLAFGPPTSNHNGHSDLPLPTSMWISQTKQSANRTPTAIKFNGSSLRVRIVSAPTGIEGDGKRLHNKYMQLDRWMGATAITTNY